MRGVVVEVGLMHVKILSDSGEIVKVPNNVVFSNSIVMEEVEEPKTVRVRYEFPVQYDPDLVLAKLRDALNEGFEECKVSLKSKAINSTT